MNSNTEIPTPKYALSSPGTLLDLGRTVANTLHGPAPAATAEKAKTGKNTKRANATKIGLSIASSPKELLTR